MNEVIVGRTMISESNAALKMGQPHLSQEAEKALTVGDSTVTCVLNGGMVDGTWLPDLEYNDEVRRTIADGDLIFCHGHKTLHSLIRFFTGSYWNHVGLLFWWKGRLVVVEAGEHGVSTVALSRFLERYKGEVYLGRYVGLSHRQAYKIHHACIDTFLGADYDTWTLIRLGIRKALGKAGFKKKAPKNKRWYCSELIRDAMELAGITFEDDAQGVISPGMIADDPRITKLGRLVLPPVNKEL